MKAASSETRNSHMRLIEKKAAVKPKSGEVQNKSRIGRRLPTGLALVRDAWRLQN